MGRKFLALSAALVIFFLTHTLSPAEKISLKLNYRTNSIKRGDLFDWIESYNLLWDDWQSRKGGIVEGQFIPPKYRANFEFELRFSILAGFFLTLSGGNQLQSRTEGTVHYKNSGEDQEEKQFIHNGVTALPFKIGVSYQFRFPNVDKLSLNLGVGRLILFASYKNSEDYSLDIQSSENVYNYWYKKKGDYRSECLGLYANLTVEYNVFKSVSLLAGLEQKWAKMEGFKGDYTYTANFEPPDNNISGKASLYFYESSQWGTGDFYSILSGNIDRPSDSGIKNVRQGKINLGGYSFIIGIRFII